LSNSSLRLKDVSFGCIDVELGF